MRAGLFSLPWSQEQCYLIFISLLAASPCPHFAHSCCCTTMSAFCMFFFCSWSSWMSLINSSWGLFINCGCGCCLHGLAQTRTSGTRKEGEKPFQEKANNSLWKELHMKQLVCLLGMKYIMTVQMSELMCSSLELRRAATWRHKRQTEKKHEKLPLLFLSQTRLQLHDDRTGFPPVSLFT